MLERALQENVNSRQSNSIMETVNSRIGLSEQLACHPQFVPPKIKERLEASYQRNRQEHEKLKQQSDSLNSDENSFSDGESPMYLDASDSSIVLIERDAQQTVGYPSNSMDEIGSGANSIESSPAPSSSIPTRRSTRLRNMGASNRRNESPGRRSPNLNREPVGPRTRGRRGMSMVSVATADSDDDMDITD